MSMLDHAARLADALRDLGDAVAATPALEGFEVGDCLRLAADRCVFAGRLGGRHVVAKLIRGPDAARAVTTLATSAALNAERMAGGPYRVPQTVVAAPEHGLYVQDWIAGDTLLAAIAAAPSHRRRLIAEAGRWLDSYTTATRAPSGVAVRRRLKEARRHAHAHTFAPGEADLLASLTRAAELAAPRLAGRRIGQARLHGDFTAENLILSSGVLTGIDLQGDARGAIGKDIAHFLVHLDIRSPAKEPPGRFGLPDADVAAMAESGVVDPAELDATLAFFVPLHLMRRADPRHTAATRRRWRRTAQRVAAALASER